MPDRDRSSERTKLLRSFDRAAGRARGFVAARYGPDRAEELHGAARREYERIIPQIPRLPGLRARALNSFLRITAQEVAVYRAVTQYGGTVAEAWEICHEALRLCMAAFPRWRAWLLKKLVFSRVMRRRVRQLARAGRHVRHGDFEIRFLIGDGEDVDFGVDYVRCGNLELARKLGAEAFAPYICMSDIALGEGLGWGLKRTQTLAAGCDHCDFRFKKNAATHITSKIPAVQQTIDQISRREADRT